MPISKEKRTKEQAMRLLDRAIEQEETLLEKVKSLETELADCRKRAENPRHELDELALPASKVSFRLDFYRTQEKGSLKGIIEHLSTRESRSFEADRFGEINDFITQFVGTISWPPEVSAPPSAKKTSPTFPPEVIKDGGEEERRERSPLLRKLLPEIFGTPAPVLSEPIIAAPAPVPERLEAEPFFVLTDGVSDDQRSVREGEPFQIGIPMQTLSNFKGKPCSVSLSAESLEKPPNQAFKTFEYCTPDQDILRVATRNLALEQGVYRLMVSMTLRDEPQQAYYQESRLLIVQ